MANRHEKQVFTNQTANITDVAFRMPSGNLSVFAWGVFNGATVTIQSSPDGVEWFDDVLGENSFTSKIWKVGDFPASFLRGVVTGAAAGTSINLTLITHIDAELDL